MVQPTIVVRNVSKKFATQTQRDAALKNVSFIANPGETLAIRGPSGSGKSTLLQITGLIQVPDEGSVEILGRRFDASSSEADCTAFRGRNIGFIFQDFALFDFLSPTENVELPLILDRVPKSKREQRISDMLKSLMLTKSDLSTKKVANLSGGERQRVAIARAMIAEAQIILADEPTGNLDSTTGKQVTQLLFDLAHKHNKTVIIVTHDQSLYEACDAHVNLLDGKAMDQLGITNLADFRDRSNSARPKTNRSNADESDLTTPFGHSSAMASDGDVRPVDQRSGQRTMSSEFQDMVEAERVVSNNRPRTKAILTGEDPLVSSSSRPESLTSFQKTCPGAVAVKAQSASAPAKPTKSRKGKGKKSPQANVAVAPAVDHKVATSVENRVAPITVVTPQTSIKSRGPVLYELVSLAVRMMKGARVVTSLNVVGLTIAIMALSFVGVFLYGIQEYIHTIIQRNPRSFVIAVTAKDQENLIDSQTRQDFEAVGHNVVDVCPVEKAKLGLRRQGKPPHDFNIRSSTPGDPLYPAHQFLIGTGIQKEGVANQPVDIVLTSDAAEILGFLKPEQAQGQELIAQVTRKRKGETRHEHADVPVRVMGVLSKTAQIQKGVSALLPLNVCQRLNLWQEAYLEKFWDQHDAAIEISENTYTRFGVFAGKASPEATITAVQRHIPQAKPIEVRGKPQPVRANEGWRLVRRADGDGKLQIPCFSGVATLGSDKQTVPQVNVLLMNISDLDRSFELNIHTLGCRGSAFVSHDLFAKLAIDDRLPELVAGTIRLNELESDWSTELKTGGVAVNLPRNTVLLDLTDQDLAQDLKSFLVTPRLDQVVVCRVDDQATARELCETFERQGINSRRFALSQPTAREVKEIHEHQVLDSRQLLGTAIDSPILVHFGNEQFQPADQRLALVTANTELFSGLLKQYRLHKSDDQNLSPLSMVIMDYRDMQNGPTTVEMMAATPELTFGANQIIEAEFPDNWPKSLNRPMPLILVPDEPGRPRGSRQFGIFSVPQVPPAFVSALVASDSDYSSIGSGWMVVALASSQSQAVSAELAFDQFKNQKQVRAYLSRTQGLRLPDSTFAISTRLFANQRHSPDMILRSDFYPKEQSLEFQIAGFDKVLKTDGPPLFSDQQGVHTALIPFDTLSTLGLILEKKRVFNAATQSTDRYVASHAARHSSANDSGAPLLRFPFADTRVLFEVPPEAKLTSIQVDQLQHRGTVGLVGHPEVIQKVGWTNSQRVSHEIELIGVQGSELQWLKESTLFLETPKSWDDFAGEGPPGVVISEDLAKQSGLWETGDRTIGVQISRPAEIDFANRSMTLKAKVIGVTHQAGLHAFVPLRLTRFLEGWKQGKSDFNTTESSFAQNSGTKKVHDSCLYCEITVRDIDSVAPTSDAIQAQYGKRFIVETDLALIEQYKYYRTIALCVFSAIAAFGLIECLVALFCTFWAETLRRRRDVAIMRVLGTSKTNILFLYLLPPQLINCVAALLGMTVTCLAVTIAKMPSMVAWCQSYLNADISGLMSIPWWGPLLVFGVSASFCFLGSVIPALYASRIPVSDAMKA